MDLTVKNILFDFGGVIFDISHEKLENACRRLGMVDFDRLFSQAAQAGLFREFEVGAISEEKFRNGLRTLTGIDVDEQILDSTWNEILCGYPPHRLALLKEIRKNYRLYLLSNTNVIHFRHYTSMYQKEYGHEFNDLFDDTFWSFKLGLRKPDPDPWLLILRKHDLDPSETLFIDDSIQNIVAAEKLGILALHLKNGTDVSDLFEAGLLKQGTERLLYRPS